MAETPGKKPRPVATPTNVTKPFWDATKQGTFMLQCCRACGAWQYYPRPVCMRCMSRNLEWKEPSGHGVIYSYTITHVPAQGFEGCEPYVIASVEIPEGTRIMAHILNCPPDAVRIGMPVRATFEPLTDQIVLLQFEPAKQELT